MPRQPQSKSAVRDTITKRGGTCGRNLEIVELRIFLLRHDLSVEEIARRAGLSPRTVRNILCGNNTSPKSLAKVNVAIGLKIFSINSNHP